jgi:hypothetical protein
MFHFDVFQLIGRNACSMSNDVASLIGQSQTCTAPETWNVGLLVMVVVAAALVVRFIHKRRMTFRETYF